MGSDLAYRADQLPIPSSLPELPLILAAHGDIAKMKEIDTRSGSGDIPLVSLDEVGLNQARAVKGWLDEFTILMEEISKEHWLLAAYHTILGVKRADGQLVLALRQTLDCWVRLHNQGRQFLLKAVTVGDTTLDDQALDRAIDDLALGKEPFGIFGFLKGGLRANIEQISIEGRAPKEANEWVEIRDYRAWLREAHAFLGRWSAIARVIGAPNLSHEDDLLRHGRLVDGIWRALSDIDHYRTTLSKLFPYGVDVSEILHHGRSQLVD